MKNQNLWYKLLKYNYKNAIRPNDTYKLKIQSYNKLFLQFGGQLVDESIDLKDTELIKASIMSIFDEISKDKDLLGRGAMGSVYLFTNNSIIKVLSNKDDYMVEFINNAVVNKLASQNLCFPKFHQMFEMDFPAGKKGVIISEKFYPINMLFSSPSSFKIAPSEVANLEKQIYFTLFSLYDFYLKTGNIIIHNDFKVDNFLLRKVNDVNSSYKYIASNGKVIEVPYINLEGNKYLVVMNDYGESFTYDGIKDNVKDIHKEIIHWKYIQDEVEFNSVNVKKYLFNNIDNFKNNIAQTEIVNMGSMTDFDKFLLRNLTNIDSIFDKFIGFLNSDIPKLEL